MKKQGGLAKTIADVVDAMSAPDRDLPVQLEKIYECDYRQVLRTFFTKREARRILKIFSEVLPELNRTTSGKPTHRYLKDLAARAGVDLKAVSFGTERRNLRGFYVPEDTALGTSATIYLNTDYAPVAVAATAYHEVAHHILETRIAPARKSIAVNFADDYASHLRDPFELLADIVVTLAAYPTERAKKLFRKPKAASQKEIPSMLTNAAAYIEAKWEFDLKKRASKREHLHYVTSMVHFAKLRRAVLDEYGL